MQEMQWAIWSLLLPQRYSHNISIYLFCLFCWTLFAFLPYRLFITSTVVFHRFILIFILALFLVTKARAAVKVKASVILCFTSTGRAARFFFLHIFSYSFLFSGAMFIWIQMQVIRYLGSLFWKIYLIRLMSCCLDDTPISSELDFLIFRVLIQVDCEVQTHNACDICCYPSAKE